MGDAATRRLAIRFVSLDPSMTRLAKTCERCGAALYLDGSPEYTWREVKCWDGHTLGYLHRNGEITRIRSARDALRSAPLALTNARGGESLGARLRRLRDGLGLNQRDAAHEAGICPSTLWGLETGRRTTRPGERIIGALSALYEVSPSYLRETYLVEERDSCIDS